MTIKTPVRSEAAITPTARPVDMKLEVAAIPVSDVDRAKQFYSRLGWRLDADFVVGDHFRGVQFTPPGSPASIHFGKGVTSAVPGSAQGLFLVVSDIEAARAELISRGVDVSDFFHVAGTGHPPIPGLDPQRRSYLSYATFKDPSSSPSIEHAAVQLFCRYSASPAKCRSEHLAVRPGYPLTGGRFKEWQDDENQVDRSLRKGGNHRGTAISNLYG
jgi:catechol 2,3-dioxygenase-like lactoylglutathione lyase family enzyme